MTWGLIIVALAGQAPSRGIMTVEDALKAIPAPQGKAHGVTPLGNPGQWIRPEDYPATAVSDESEGRVAIRLKVDPKGRVSDCAVTISSGNPVLDDTACNLLVQRAVFDPAVDPKGKPTWGSVATQVVWKMRDTMPFPKQMEVVTSFVVEADGSVRDCQMAGKDLPEDAVERNRRHCESSRFTPFEDDNGQPVARRVRTALRVDIEPID